MPLISHSFCLLYLSIASTLLSPTPPSSCSPSTELQCRNIIQMMANHRSLEKRGRQPEITKSDNQCVCVCVCVSWLHWLLKFVLMFMEELWLVEFWAMQLTLVHGLMVLLTGRTSAMSCGVVDVFQALAFFLMLSHLCLFIIFFSFFLSSISSCVQVQNEKTRLWEYVWSRLTDFAIGLPYKAPPWHPEKRFFLLTMQSGGSRRPASSPYISPAHARLVSLWKLSRKGTGASWACS